MPAAGFEYGPLLAGDLPAAARMIHLAFAGPLDGAESWIRAAGVEHMRVVRTAPGATPIACLMRIPMGQYLGGRSIRMLGIAGVAVAPEARGEGLAAQMMAAGVAEAARDGFPISTLYPSTIGLYRQSGYELAGHRFVTTIDIGRIDAPRGGGHLRPLTDQDGDAMKACYTQFAAGADGALDRGDYCWSRVRELRGTRYHAFGLDDGRGGLAAYILLSQERDPKSGFHSIAVSDCAFVNGDAGRRLLRFIADFATMGEHAVLYGGPMHPLVALMSSRHYRVEKKDYWMTRVLDVKAAFEARGYPRSARCEWVLNVRDSVIAGNTGRWRVRIADGRAEVAPAGATTSGSAGALPELACDARALAPLLTGLHSIRQLATLGWLEPITPDAIDLIDGVIPAATPWMTDMF